MRKSLWSSLRTNHEVPVIVLILLFYRVDMVIWNFAAVIQTNAANEIGLSIEVYASSPPPKLTRSYDYRVNGVSSG